ncbi:Quinidine resistance protein 2 [Cytospora mali]|uniref:Quinidine resistance protein 2 n=1 Tax=Cytospora mali TaxID=578113 RepID=A0A194VVW0_CYTMA|nr:Quinidine resistance protein 2 [Valsa mali]
MKTMVDDNGNATNSETATFEHPLNHNLTVEKEPINSTDKIELSTTTDQRDNGEVDRDERAIPADQEPTSEQPVPSPSPDGDPSQAVPPRYSAFTLWEKRFIVLGASLSAFFSPLTAQIYYPALNILQQDFHVSSSQINLTVTTYMIFQGITPMFIGGLADTAGRRPAYVVCFVIYIGANIGVALCQTYGQLMVLRCLQSAGSASTVALCQAVVADTITSGERGQYIGITVLPIVLAPSLGPVLGGILSQYLGWRSIFWFLTILAAINLIAMLLFFPETCRKIVGDGSVRAHPAYRTLWQMAKDHHRRLQAKKSNDPPVALQRVTTSTSSKPRPKLTIKFGNPFDSITIIFEPLLGLLLGYSAIVFASFYSIATVMPSEFERLYGFDDIKVGLMYLPMAGGSIVAAFVVGPAINWNYRRHAKRLGISLTKGSQDDLSNFPIERARIEVGMPLLVISTSVCFAWGWALQYNAPVAVPCVLLFLMGIGMIGFNNAAMVLVTDMYRTKAGAATAANNFTRCLIGAAFTAAISPMIQGIGAGWSFSILGFLCLAGAPLLLLIMRNGIKWRRNIRQKDERKKAKAAGKKQRQSDQNKVPDADKVSEKEISA